MEKSKVLWLDCDGVLLDWVRPFLEYIKSPVKYEDLTQYDLSNLCKDNTEVMVHHINYFNSTPKYAYLEPLVSKEDLNRLKRRGYDLRIISQVDGEKARENRLHNIYRLFGIDMFSKIILTSRGESKARLLRAIEPYEKIEVVEDNPGFFDDAYALDPNGFRCWMIRHPYNELELIQRNFCPFSSTKELIEELCAE